MPIMMGMGMNSMQSSIQGQNTMNPIFTNMSQVNAGGNI
jgi:hypothetical protein